VVAGLQQDAGRVSKKYRARSMTGVEAGSLSRWRAEGSRFEAATERIPTSRPVREEEESSLNLFLTVSAKRDLDEMC